MEIERVLLIHNYYQQGGGEHTVFENEVCLLRQHGVNVFTYTRDNKDLKKKPWLLILTPFSTIWSFSSYRAVKRIIRQHNIQLVHCHNTFPQISPSVYYAAWSCGIPVVQTIHNFRFICPNGLCFRDGQICEDCLAGGLKSALFHGCYRGSRIQTLPVVLMLSIHRMLRTYKKLPCIFLTKFNKEKIASALGLPAANIFIRGNLVKSEQKMKAVQIKKNRFVYAGRLDTYKGVEWMLDRFSQHPELDLVIFGDGDLRWKVEKIAASYPNIKLRGQCEHSEVLAGIASAVALVFPSLLYEGFPMVIAESFALGVPVLCSNVGNGAQIVRQTGGGVLYDLENLKSFDKAVNQLLRDRSNLATKAYQAAIQWGPEFSWRSLKKIYEEIIRHGTTS